MKSSTERPEENRAVRDVGSTWFGPADIVADGLGRVAPQKHRAGVLHAIEKHLRRRRCDLQMLGRDRINQRRSILEFGHHDDRAMIAPRACRDLAAGQLLQLRVHRGRNPVRKFAIVRDQDRL